MIQPVVAILGLGKGVGAACARRFHDGKWSVLIADPDAERLEKTKNGLHESVAAQHDEVHTRLGARNCLAACLEAFDRIDWVIHIPPVLRFENSDREPLKVNELTLDDMEKGFARTSLSALNALQVFTPALIEQNQTDQDRGERRAERRGFTFILSMSAISSDPGRAAAGISQASTKAVMEAAAIDLAPDGIRSNAIASVRPRAESDEEDWLKRRTPLGRTTTSDEIAEAALYLSSPAAAFMTGHTMVLDGGRSRLNGVMG